MERVKAILQRLTDRPPVLLLHISILVILTGAVVTWCTSRRGYVHLRTQHASQSFIIPDDGHRTMPMPFYLCLDSFRVETDAVGNPTDYISYVKLHDNNGSKQMTISMNNIARRSGYRIFQTSFDDDLHGSIFTVSYDPWGTAITYLGYALCVVSMIWISVSQRSLRRRAKGWVDHLGWALGVVFALYMIVPLMSRPLMPVLRHPMLFLHVGAMIVSYCLLIVSAFNRAALRPAVFTLATGIFLGAMWANISWGAYWSWDPKETWALITLLIYSVPLHLQSLPWFRSTRHYRIYSVFALASLIMTYFGVNYLLGGMHSYMN